MLKSEIIKSLNLKHPNLSNIDIEKILSIFLKKITDSLDNGNNIEIRGFGTLSKKLNKEKYVRNPKTNKKIYKKETFKIHFKTGKTLHKRLNSFSVDEI